MKTLTGVDCSKGIMESRARMLGGKFYCQACSLMHDDRLNISI